MRRISRGLAAAWGAMAMCAAHGAVEIRYGFRDAANLGADDSGQRTMICVNGTQTESPAGKGVAFAGTGRLELAAEKRPDFRRGFGVEFLLRADAPDRTMVVAGLEGQFLLRLQPTTEVSHLPSAAGYLTFHVYGRGWEPRLEAPIPAWGQWIRVRAGWDGHRMLLRVDDHEEVQIRRIRLAASDAPLIVGGPRWGAPLKGALADFRLHAPAPQAWFAAHEAPPPARIAGAAVEVFEVDNAYPRAGRAEKVNLWLLADVCASGGTATLRPGPGVVVLDENAARAVPAMEQGAAAEFAWTVRAETPGTHALMMEDGAGQTLRINVSFHPPNNHPRLDHVPAPVPVPTQALIGAHMCPLWKEGEHFGWQRIVPWPDRKPALGWYDEGDPDVTDWEIKWSVDHGISFFIYCWFRASQGGPVEQRLSHAIHEGLFHARHRDKFKFAIMWENSLRGQAGVASEEDFLQNLLPFWIETYFKRPNYLVLDGKPLLFVYHPEYVADDLGGVAQARRAFDLAREASRAAGFQGLTLIGEYRGLDPARMRRFAEIGMDYIFAYCWPLSGNPSSARAVEMQSHVWRQRRELGILPEILTVSMGWDPRPWHPSTTVWRLTPDDFAEACRRALAEAALYPEASLSRRLILLDNWNEFGEGHYLMPHREHGFGYLAAAREALAPDAPHREGLDLTPADVGLGPYDHLYRAARIEAQRIRRLMNALPKVPVVEEGLVAHWTFDEAPDSDVALDVSGHRLGAHIVGARRGPGLRGSALVCDGGVAQTAVDPRLFPEAMTVALWVWTDRAGQNDRWMLNSIRGPWADMGYRLGLVGGKLRWGAPESSWSHHVNAPAPLPLGRWAHVAATADDTIMRLYQDGVEVASLPRALPPAAPANQPLILGNFGPGHVAHFQGLLDEVRLYNRALSPERIAELALPPAVP